MVPLGEGFSPAAVPLGRWIGALVEAYPYLPIGMIGPGLILLLLLGNPSVPFSRRPLLGLWDIYSLATGVPTDILSYLRLFALGLSGALLGSAVNMVSFGLYQNTIWSSIAACLVWLIGHSINFALVLLSAFVHPLRLTFVEFYKSMDFKGGGLAYSPFKKNTPKPYTTHGNSPLSTLHDGPG
jgi:V/A-type H+-transporting ATPase subunit I